MAASATVWSNSTSLRRKERKRHLRRAVFYLPSSILASLPARVVKWQTRTFEGRMPQGMGVQVPPRALPLPCPNPETNRRKQRERRSGSLHNSGFHSVPSVSSCSISASPCSGIVFEFPTCKIGPWFPRKNGSAPPALTPPIGRWSLRAKIRTNRAAPRRLWLVCSRPIGTRFMPTSSDAGTPNPTRKTSSRRLPALAGERRQHHPQEFEPRGDRCLRHRRGQQHGSGDQCLRSQCHHHH